MWACVLSVFERESAVCIAQIKNDDTDVGKWEPCAQLVGMYGDAAAVDSGMEGPQNVRHGIPTGPSNAAPGPVLEISADRVSSRYAHTCVRTAASFTTAEGGSSPGPSAGDGRTERGPPARWTLWLCQGVGRARLSTPSWTAARQAPLSTKFSRQEHWSGLPRPPPGALLNPGMEPGSFASQADSPPSEPPGKPNGTLSSLQFSSVAQPCLTLCDPMNYSTPGLPVHYQIPEFTQTHVH